SDLPAALGQYRESLLSARDKGNVAPRRQVEQGITQCADLTASDGYFATLVRRGAVESYRNMGEFLRTELLHAAPEADACGIDRYRLVSRHFVGATVDLEEAYQWGIEECARLVEQMRSVANRIKPG